MNLLPWQQLVLDLIPLQLYWVQILKTLNDTPEQAKKLSMAVNSNKQLISSQNMTENPNM